MPKHLAQGLTVSNSARVPLQTGMSCCCPAVLAEKSGAHLPFTGLAVTEH